MSSAAVFSVSLERLEYELAQAELALQQKEAATDSRNDNESSHASDDPDNALSLLQQLSGLNQSADDLSLAQDVAQWMKQCRTAADENSDSTLAVDDDPSLLLQSQHFHRLGDVILQHRTGSLQRQIWEQEYEPMLDYLQQMLLRHYRSLLKSAGYPQQCHKILQAWEENTPQFQELTNAALWLYKLQSQRPIVRAHVHGQSTPPAFQSTSSVVTELCRPFVERIRHHFVKTMETDRMERLPEWLFAYIKEHIFSTDQDGPWDVVHYALAPIIAPNHLTTDFVNEIVTLCQYVFSEHNLFRHDRIVNANNPQSLCAMIQQLLEMDDFLAKTVQNQADRVLSFMDLYVANDEELFQWWMDRERESFLDDLFFGLPESDEKDTPLISIGIHPRAELFASLIQSIQYKASVFQFSGPYLQHVASPLCVRFMEAVQESAVDLKRVLFAGSRAKLPPLSSWKRTCGEWLALMNGVRLAANQILDNSDKHDRSNATNSHREQEIHHDRSSARSDLLEFGQSLKKFEMILTEEFGRLFVETLLLEKARFSSYLIQCSQLLSTPKNAPLKDPSPELTQTEELLRTFLQVVQEPASPLRDEQETSLHAYRQLRDEVLTNISLKFLEVLLNWHGIADGSGINTQGMELITSHIELLFGEALLPHTAMRLLDVCKLMQDRGDATALMDALCGLAGQPAPPLEIESFVMDDRISEEATSMLRAKKYLWLELQDALLIINRRLPDLNPMLQFAAF